MSRTTMVALITEIIISNLPWGMSYSVLKGVSWIIIGGMVPSPTLPAPGINHLTKQLEIVNQNHIFVHRKIKN